LEGHEFYQYGCQQQSKYFLCKVGEEGEGRWKKANGMSGSEMSNYASEAGFDGGSNHLKANRSLE